MKKLGTENIIKGIVALIFVLFLSGFSVTIMEIDFISFWLRFLLDICLVLLGVVFGVSIIENIEE